MIGGINLKYFFSIIFIILLLSGCNSDTIDTTDTYIYFDTKEDAIQHGITVENITEEEILSVEEHMGETIVFFEKDKALGVVTIPKNEKGYRWYRNTPLSGFAGDIDYSNVTFDIETSNGKKISILAGRIFDFTIERVIIKNKKTEFEKEIWVKELNKSELYYSIIDGSFGHYEVIVQREKQ